LIVYLICFLHCLVFCYICDLLGILFCELFGDRYRQYEHIKIKNTSFFYLDFILRKFNITLRRKPRACLLSLIVHFSVRRRNLLILKQLSSYNFIYCWISKGIYYTASFLLPIGVKLKCYMCVL
jgi:hypothetical protein